KDPRRRYRTAGDVADELRRFLNREPIKARPVSPQERALKWARRRPAVAALIAVCFAAFTVVSWQLVAYIGLHRDTDALRRDAERRLTQSSLDRALEQLNQGDTARGMLGLTHA